MKYLMEGQSPADTYFNVWPVPVLPVASMAKVTQAVHAEIFADDEPQDSGAEDGAGSVVVAYLGEKVIPFPREMSDKLTREMIHIWSVEVGVIFNPGAGLALLAFILENKRAVGIMKNKAHRDFVKGLLIESVKTMNLAPDTRPPKPTELTTREAFPGRRGMVVAKAIEPVEPGVPKAPSAGTPPMPSMPSMPSMPPVSLGSPQALLPPVAPMAQEATNVPETAPPAVPLPVARAGGLAAFGASPLR